MNAEYQALQAETKWLGSNSHKKQQAYKWQLYSKGEPAVTLQVCDGCFNANTHTNSKVVLQWLSMCHNKCVFYGKGKKRHLNVKNITFNYLQMRWFSQVFFPLKLPKYNNNNKKKTTSISPCPFLVYDFRFILGVQPMKGLEWPLKWFNAYK